MNTSRTQDYPLQDWTHISELIRTRQVSPVEVVSACLERIDMQSKLNAFISVGADSATQAARTAEREIESGRWRGPLHGMPIGIKDFYDTAGLRTTAAFEPFKDRVPEKDAVAVEKLKAAGAIILGKTNMHTLGMGTTGLESCFGPARNPWNPAYIPGGSSSGSAVATASGLCYATLDTDAIGSCRLPAACCGVVGFKSSYGAINLQGILEGEQPPDDTIRWLSHAGVTTRSIPDLALVLDALMNAAHEPEPVSLPRNGPARIGVADNIAVHADVSNAFDHAVATLKGLGLSVRPTSIPFTDFAMGIATIERDRQNIEAAAFNEIDVMVLPTTTTATPAVREARKDRLALSPQFTMFANYYGLPAVSLPCGLDSRGLPIGLQIVGKPGHDSAVLQLARRYEEVVEFAPRRPPD
jgi:aspartyl-tRNA(Asn)/glutamyl-tRNA(Gln) amidotransferase subunit A